MADDAPRAERAESETKCLHVASHFKKQQHSRNLPKAAIRIFSMLFTAVSKTTSSAADIPFMDACTGSRWCIESLVCCLAKKKQKKK